VQFTGPFWNFLEGFAAFTHFEKRPLGGRWIAVVFHHLTDGCRYRANDPLVSGLRIDLDWHVFRDRVKWLANRYEFISLEAVIQKETSPKGNRQKLLMCFDDAYASVFHLAAPILRDLNIPWCFFINPGSVNNARLAVDNIVAYIENTRGLSPLSSQAMMKIGGAREFISEYLSKLRPYDRRAVVENLAAELNINLESLAQKSGLYVTADQIRALADAGVEIGCHTFDHVHCRSLDVTAAAAQIESSGRAIKRLSGRSARAFAYPYGSMLDATSIARRAIINAGYQCAFLMHNRANFNSTDCFAYYRIDLGYMDYQRAVLGLEVLPRMREVVAEVRTLLS
jgi:peptidoglycan/xylan/chitin deacetylase (PgdA/CDA1 family)